MVVDDGVDEKWNHDSRDFIDGFEFSMQKYVEVVKIIQGVFQQSVYGVFKWTHYGLCGVFWVFCHFHENT